MISVALCTYNGEKYLREQLESLAAQTLLPVEVHVGDDGSTDGTIQLLREFEAPFPIHVTVNEQRLGYGENFIATARRCTSPWIAFCDQDDIWLPEKLERCAGEIRDNVYLVAHNAEIRGEGKLPEFETKPVNPRLSLVPRWFCLGFCQVFSSAILDVRRVPLPWAEVADAHDTWVAFIAGMMGEIIWIEDPLAKHRLHRANVSHALGSKLIESSFADASRIAAQLGFADAAAHYARCEERLRLRGEARKGSVRAFLKLLFSGGYRSGSYDRFGKRAMVEDALALL
jgi:glycosyltransferase involved in cell wall biosynthesis